MKPPTCPNCRYNLRGLDDESHRCPECGAGVHFEELQLRARPLPRISLINYPRAIGITFTVLVVWAVVSFQSEWTWLTVIVCLPLIVVAIIAFEWRDFALTARTQAGSSDQWTCVIATNPDGVRIIGRAPDGTRLDDLYRWDSMAYVRCEWWSGLPVLRFAGRDVGVIDSRRASYQINSTVDDAETMVRDLNLFILTVRRSHLA